jgi:hypothetical protein
MAPIRTFARRRWRRRRANRDCARISAGTCARTGCSWRCRDRVLLHGDRAGDGTSTSCRRRTSPTSSCRTPTSSSWRWGCCSSSCRGTSTCRWARSRPSRGHRRLLTVTMGLPVWIVIPVRSSPGPDRRGAGLLGGLLAHPVLHRDARRDARVPGLTLWLLGGQNIGPFPRSFQAMSNGFVPDLFGEWDNVLLGLERLNSTAILVVVLAALLLIWLGLRAGRATPSSGSPPNRRALLGAQHHRLGRAHLRRLEARAVPRACRTC